MSEASENKLRFPSFKSAPKASSNAGKPMDEVATESETRSLQKLFDRHEEKYAHNKPNKEETSVASREDYISLSTGSIVPDTKDCAESVSPKLTESLHAKLRRDPFNVQLWLEFASQQEPGHYLSPLQLAERQHAILTKALRANPKSFVLLERLLQTENILLEPAALLRSWDKHLRRWRREVEGNATELWKLTKKFIHFRLFHFQSYNVAQLESVFREVFGQMADYPFSIRVELLCMYLAFLARSGKTEKLTAIVWTVSELNRSSADLDGLAEQWDAGLYEFFPGESLDHAERGVPSELTQCASWAWRERCRERLFWHPRFGSDDPEQELSFDDDIRPFILRASDPSASKTLVRVVLSCLLHSVGLLSLSLSKVDPMDMPLFSARVSLEKAVIQRHLCWDDMVCYFDCNSVYTVMTDHLKEMPHTMIRFLFRVFETLLPLFMDDLSFLTYFFVLSEFQMAEAELSAYLRRLLSDNRAAATGFLAYGRFLMLKGADSEAERALIQVARRHKTKEVALFLCELYSKTDQMSSLSSVLSWFIQDKSLVIGCSDSFGGSVCNFDEANDPDLVPYCHLVAPRTFISDIASGNGIALLMHLRSKSPITEQFELLKTLLPKALDCIMITSKAADLYCLIESFARVEDAVKYKRGLVAFLQENVGKVDGAVRVFVLELLMLWQAKACSSDEQSITRLRNWLKSVHLESPLLAATYVKLESEASVNVYEIMRVFPGFKQLHIELAAWTEAIAAINVMEEQEVRLRTFIEEFD